MLRRPAISTRPYTLCPSTSLFRSTVELQSSPEASGAERRMAEFALLRYHNLPIAEALPSDDQIAAFAELIEDPENQPVLVHGASLDQAAAMWALYRAAPGVPAGVALDTGSASVRARGGRYGEIS